MGQPTVTGLTLNAGSGGDDLAKVTYAGEEYQCVLMSYWDGSSAVHIVEEAKPLPVGFNTAKDGSGTLYAPLVDADGHIQVDALSCASHEVTNAGTFAVQAAQSGTWNIGTITAVTAISNALPAGDNNIGNVDIVTLPAGNLGMQAMAASLSVVPANDITDGTYIGDVKFGEALPAGTNAIGKLAANDGVDIGDVTINNAGGVEVIQNTAADLNVTEASATAIKTAVEIIDDWDESDRAKVNVIAGQAGIAGGTGTDGATVPRVSLATDVGLPPGTAEMGFVGAAAQSDYAYDGSAKCTIKRFHAVTSTSDTSIITAVAAKKFRILSMTIIALSATATNVHLETKTTNTDCFGDSTNPIPVAVDADGDNHGGVVLGWNPGGWFETADANEDMAIILSAAQPVMICGNYIEVD